MSKDEMEIEEGREMVRRTIVGGRPLAKRKKKIRIPIGIEKTLCLAAASPSFRDELLASRSRALKGAGYELRLSEAHILDSVPQDTLEKMIDHIDLKRHTRRKFMRNVAASIMASSLATVALGCGGDDDGKDVDNDAETGSEVVDTEEVPIDGITPDVYETTETAEMGITPDVDELDTFTIDTGDISVDGITPDDDYEVYETELIDATGITPDMDEQEF